MAVLTASREIRKRFPLHWRGAFYESEFLLVVEQALAVFFGVGDVNPEPFIGKLRKDANKAARIAETIKD